MRTIPKDYYKILEVAEDAGSMEIKKKYRYLAMEYHPDHNPDDPKCEEKFKEISEAYGVLIDPVKRREYDRYRAGAYSGTYGDSSQFRYSQQDIFENMFRSAFARDVFKELNREFSQSGFRSGPGFFKNMFFGGGAMSGLTRFLWLLPGPLGRVGQVIRLVQMVGSSLFVLNRVRKVYQKDQSTVDGGERENPLVDSIKGLFGMKKKPEEFPLDINFQMIIPPSEAVSGAKKEISYQLQGQTERLAIRIPPGVRSGQKLRIKEKGHQKNGRRGDLILSIQVESE